MSMMNSKRCTRLTSPRHVLRILLSLSMLMLFVGPSIVTSSGPNPMVVTAGPEPIQVSAVASTSADLPCDVSPRHLNDSVLLVVWYRDDTPIYSWDARTGVSASGDDSQNGAHWSGVEGGGRAAWDPKNARLTLQPAQPKDRGDYRCRADFRASPTRNTRVHLQIIEAANIPRVFNERGVEIRSKAGPYREGDAPQLTCNVTGGFPPATVRWYRGGRAVEGQGSMTGLLRLPPLRRSDLLAELSCQASNSPLLAPTTATLQIDMELTPLNIEVQEKEPLSAGRSHEIICKARGGRPPPKLSWWLDGQRIGVDSPQEDSEGEPGEKVQQSEDENKESNEKTTVSTSTLKLHAKAQQHGQRLMCRATHDLLNTPMEAILTLNVLFAPTVELTLGTTLNPNDIEEDDDVYFECKVRANPPPYKLIWEHDNKALVQDLKSNVYVSNNNLVLRTVKRSAAGSYACSASNVEGDARSQVVNLRIMYKPVCTTTLRRSYGVARQERAQLICEVEAVPPPDTFYWALNNSLGGPLTEVTSERFTMTSTPPRSTLTYMPISDLDYGTALCWATNLVGKQLTPCALTLLPASRPHSPANCSLTNQTSAALEIICDPGYDGGLQQWFLLEVYERPHDILLANVSASRPAFMVGGLGAGRTLRLLVYAANTRGRSEPIPLDGFTLELAEKHTGNVTNIEITSLVGMLVGAIVTMLLLLIIFLVIFKLKHRMSSNYTIQSGKQKNQCTRQQPPRAQILTLQDDKNPDVVPLNKAEHKLTLEEPNGDMDSSLGSGGSFVGPSHPPPYSSCMTTHLTHTPPIPMVETRSRAGREVVTTRAPLPAAQESDV